MAKNAMNEVLSDTQSKRIHAKIDLQGAFATMHRAYLYPAFDNGLIAQTDEIAGEFISLCKQRLESRAPRYGGKTLELINRYISGGDEIILDGVNFGIFANIEKNIFYALLDIDLLINHIHPQNNVLFFIGTKQKHTTHTKTVLEILKPVPRLENSPKKRAKLWKPYNQNGSKDQNGNEIAIIPPTKYKANTHLIRALFYSDFRPLITAILREFAFTYASIMRGSKKNTNTYYNSKLDFIEHIDLKKNLSDDLIKWNFEKNFLPLRFLRHDERNSRLFFTPICDLDKATFRVLNEVILHTITPPPILKSVSETLDFMFFLKSRP